MQPRPQPRIDFSYHEVSGPDVCSLICVLPSDPTHYWGDIFTRWPNWKKTVKSFHDTYCRHAIWQENYELFSKTFIYNLDTRACTKLQSSFPLTYFLYMFIQNLKMWYRKGNLLWSIDNKPLEDWWFQIVYVCLRLSSWLLKRKQNGSKSQFYLHIIFS